MWEEYKMTYGNTWLTKMNKGETMQIELISTGTTSNGKAYITFKKIGEEKKYNMNCNPNVLGKAEGIYTLKCDNVSDTGFPYISLHHVDDSWIRRDELMQEKTSYTQDTTYNNSILSDISRIQKLKTNLSNKTAITTKLIDNLLFEYYALLGKQVYENDN